MYVNRRKSLSDKDLRYLQTYFLTCFVKSLHCKDLQKFVSSI